MPDIAVPPPPAGARVAPIRQSGPPREIDASSMPGNPNRQPRNPPPAAQTPPPAPDPSPAPPTPPPAPPAAPKPDSAAEREKRAADFAAKKAGVEPEAPAAAPGDQPPAEPSGQAAAAPSAKGKVNPWKLVDEYKGKLATLEKELLTTKNAIVPEAERTQLTERVTKAEARAKELEDQIRFVDYSKSSEFVEKYDQPYQKAFQRAIADLSEIPVIDPATQQARAASPQDLQTFLSLPLGEARALAKEMFGDFADDVMGHRKEIKALLDQRASALDDARKNGALREQQTKEQRERQMSEVGGFVRKTFQEVNDEAAKIAGVGEFFSHKLPEEGLEPTPEEKQWNKVLDEGFKLVNEGWSQNPMNPDLSPEQRKAIVQRHVAIRNRAAAFGPMKLEIGRLRKELDAAKKELSQYSASTPEAGGSQPAGVPAASGDPRADRERRAEEFARKRAAR